MEQYPQFPGLEFDVELTPGQIAKVKAKLDQNYTADPEMGVTGWPEGKDLAKAIEMLFSQLLKGKIHVADASATIVAKMNAALSGKGVQDALSAAWAKVQAITEKVTKSVTIAIESAEGYFTFGEGKVTGYRLPLTINVNGKTVDREVRLPAELFTALAESTEAMNTAQTLFGAVTFKLDESLFPDRKTHRAWEVQQVEGVWQPVKAERSAPANGGTHAPKGGHYEIVDPATTPESIFPIAETGQKAAFYAYAQKYPGKVNPATSLNLPDWSAKKLAKNQPYIRLIK